MGIISINTEGVRELARHNMRRLETSMRAATGESVTHRLTDLIQQHMYLSSGFISGAVVAFTF